MKFILLLFTIALLFNACNKDSAITVKDCEAGQIAIFEKYTCGLSDNVVIRNQEELETHFINFCGPHLPPIYVPEFDFTGIDMIGLKATGSGCTRTFETKFTDCLETQSYLYKVIVTENGDCEPLETRVVWIQVPDLNDNWTINFEVENR